MSFPIIKTSFEAGKKADGSMKRFFDTTIYEWAYYGITEVIPQA
jgi:hypothetical protein